MNELGNILASAMLLIQNKNGLLKNRTFLVTGKLNGISRAEVKSLIEENSGTTVSSVSKKLELFNSWRQTNKKKN